MAQKLVVTFLVLTSIPTITKAACLTKDRPKFNKQRYLEVDFVPLIRRHSNNLNAQISWNGIVENEECVDYYIVKYGIDNDNQDIKIVTNLEADVIVERNKLYNFQVVAVEALEGDIGK